MPNFNCPFCTVFTSVLMGALLSHLKQNHSFERNYVCIHSECPRTFLKLESMERHVYRDHRDILIRANGGQDGPVMSNEEPHGHQLADTNQDDQVLSNQGPNDRNNALPENDAVQVPNDQGNKRTAAAFLLETKTTNKLTQVAVDNMVSNVQNLMAHTTSTMKATLKRKFQEAGLDVDNSIPDWEEVFNSGTELFAELESANERNEYFKQEFGLVEPQEKVLGTQVGYVGIGPKRRITEVKAKFYVVPFQENVKALLRNNQYRKKMFETHMSENEQLIDICDGSFVQDHRDIFHGEGVLGLQIILYYDDVEICNPLGSKVKKHKLGMIYYMFGNLHPKYRSKTSSIHLYAIFKVSDLDNFSIDEIMRPLLQDIQALHDIGYNIELADGEHIVCRGFVIACVADTLAAHTLAGFKEGVGFSLRKCRQCMAMHNDMQQNYLAQDFCLRHSDVHEQQCTVIQNAVTEELKSHHSTNYGVTRRSLLCDFPNFSVCENLPQDVMHILLEGCLPHYLRLMLKHFVYDLGVCNIQELNSRVVNFNYEYMDIRNRPSIIKEKHIKDGGLRQSAVQMWTLARFLPFCMHDVIDFNHDIWQCFVILLQITAICMSPIITTEKVDTLRTLIFHHLQWYKLLFHENIIPKQHYLLHIPAQILKFGPPVRLWCMRFEAKHNFFKSRAAIANFKNIAKYMCISHQNAQSRDLMNPNTHPSFSKEFVCGPCQMHRNQGFAIGEINRLLQVNVQHSVYIARWVKCDGFEFKTNRCCILYRSQDGGLVFGKVKAIWVVSGTEQHVYFRVQCLEMIEIDTDIMAYIVDIPLLAAGYDLVEINGLVFPEPMPMHEIGGRKCIPFKYDVFEG